MEILANIASMRRWSADAHAAGQRVALVPTMGYLHAGHTSLVRLARERAQQVVASIFVNPTQFGASEDLAAYPRDLERDKAMLSEAGADALFLPTEAMMYPPGHQTSVSVAEVTRGLCGASRPVHFRGVATIVTKLFNIVRPDVAVFGRKDFQQLVAIRRMAADLDYDIEIIGGPIVREDDGVAMSSRNAYLKPAERVAARCLSRALSEARALAAAGERNASAILAAADARIAAEPLAQIDYATLVDPETLTPIDTLDGPALLALAVQIGRARLIDNEVLNEAEPTARTPRR